MMPFPTDHTPTEMTTQHTKGSTPAGTQDPTTPPRYTYEIPIGVSVAFFIIIIIIIILIVIVMKRRKYRSLTGNNGDEIEMEDPLLLRNDAESQL